MNTDEREEGLREVASLGNLKAAQYYINAGVHVDTKNNVNGYTPLHWAAIRGHDKMVHLLLSNGAKSYVTNTKGETPFDVASTNEIRVMLGGAPVEEQPQEADSTGAPTFIPSYLTQPDLAKAWSLPGETAGLPSLEPPNKPYPRSGSIEQSTKAEVLVYARAAGSETTLLGSIVANTDSSIENMLNTVNDEIDDVPASFKLYKIANGAEIPINKKQYSKLVSDVMRNATAIVLQEQ